jgi:hypothetical protein
MPAVEPYLKSAGSAGGGSRKEYQVPTRPMGTVGRRSRRIVAAVVCAAAAAVAAAYAAIPRRADLTAFDPAEVARLETAM